jgi:hypothetical protein
MNKLAAMVALLIALAKPAYAATISENIGTLATVGTIMNINASGPALYSATFSDYDSVPNGDFYWYRQGIAINGSANLADGANVGIGYGLQGGSGINFDYKLSFSSDKNSLFSSFGRTGDDGLFANFGDRTDSLQKVGLYNGSLLIELANLTVSQSGTSAGATFYNFAQTPISAGVIYTLDIVGTTGASGFNVVQGTINDISPVPIPAALPMFSLALVALFFTNWRRVTAS